MTPSSQGKSDPIKYICPTCFLEQEGTADQPDCGDCNSEGIQSVLVPMDLYLEKNELYDLAHYRQEWIGAEDEHKPSYHRLVLKRLKELIRKKRILSGLPAVDITTFRYGPDRLTKLLYQLTRKSVEQRQKALSEFFELSSEDQGSLLNWALDPPGRLSAHAKRFLSALDQKPAEAMNAVLHAHIDTGNFAMAGQLNAWGKPATTVLLKGLQDSDEDIRRAALYYLGFVENPTAELGEALLAVSDRVLAIDALGAISKKESRFSLALVDYLKDSDARVRQRALNVLGNIRPIQPPVLNRLLEELEKTPSETYRSLLFLLLAQIGPSAAAALPLVENYLKKPHANESFRNAIFLLDQWQRQDVPGAAKLLALYQKNEENEND